MITVFSDRDDYPASAVLTPALGQSALTSGEVTTVRVEPASVVDATGDYRFSVTGYEHIVTSAAAMTVSSNAGATGTFTPSSSKVDQSER